MGRKVFNGPELPPSVDPFRMLDVESDCPYFLSYRIRALRPYNGVAQYPDELAPQEPDALLERLRQAHLRNASGERYAVTQAQVDWNAGACVLAFQQEAEAMGVDASLLLRRLCPTPSSTPTAVKAVVRAQDRAAIHLPPKPQASSLASYHGPVVTPNRHVCV